MGERSLTFIFFSRQALLAHVLPANSEVLKSKLCCILGLAQLLVYPTAAHCSTGRGHRSYSSLFHCKFYYLVLKQSKSCFSLHSFQPLPQNKRQPLKPPFYTVSFDRLNDREFQSVQLGDGHLGHFDKVKSVTRAISSTGSQNHQIFLT